MARRRVSLTCVTTQDFAHESAIQTAKILALTGLEVLQNETYAEAMWTEWKAMMEEVSITV